MVSRLIWNLNFVLHAARVCCIFDIILGSSGQLYIAHEEFWRPKMNGQSHNNANLIVCFGALSHPMQLNDNTWMIQQHIGIYRYFQNKVCMYRPHMEVKPAIVIRRKYSKFQIQCLIGKHFHTNDCLQIKCHNRQHKLNNCRANENQFG